MRAALVVLLVVSARAPATAYADGRHVVQRGETLEHVAKLYGCSTDAVLRANHLRTTLVPAKTIVVVPSCRAVVRAARVAIAPDVGADRRARHALAVIDGQPDPDPTPVVAADAPEVPPADSQILGGGGGGDPDDSDGDDHQSRGVPWRGALRDGQPLPPGEGYLIRRPGRSYGASHVITQLRGVIAEIRAKFPRVHTLAIGDLSARDGGKLGNHLSHQTGLDVDVGFYFKRVPEGYPESFVTADDNLDYEATWALLRAFTRTADLERGVQMIFLDYDVQARLYRWAAAHGTPRDELDATFQYPHGKDAFEGVVRHWPHHGDHFHVRFKPAD